MMDTVDDRGGGVEEWSADARNSVDKLNDVEVQVAVREGSRQEIGCSIVCQLVFQNLQCSRSGGRWIVGPHSLARKIRNLAGSLRLQLAHSSRICLQHDSTLVLTSMPLGWSLIRTYIHCAFLSLVVIVWVGR